VWCAGGEEACIQDLTWEIQKENQDVDEWMMLKWTSERYNGVELTALIWLRIEIGGGLF
jgi:hypothetical protein